MKRLPFYLLLCWLVSSIPSPAQSQITSSLPYAPDQLVEGELHIVGSSTMGQLAALWAEGFRKVHPNAKITIDCSGSETALPELKQQSSLSASGEAKQIIGLISRPLNIAQQNATTGASEQQLLSIMVCQDPVAVIAHPSNPIESLAWDPNDQILLSADYRSLQQCLASSGTWGGISLEETGLDETGLEETWNKKTITVCAPQAGHGTRTVLDQWFFGVSAMSEADTEATTEQKHKAKFVEYAEREQLIEAVAKEPAAIGLASLSLGGLDAVKQIPISIAGLAPVAPTHDAIDDGTYPLIRPLFLVVTQNVATQEGTLKQEFIRYVLSNFGQTDVIKDGFVPLTRSELLMQTEKLSGEIVR